MFLNEEMEKIGKDSCSTLHHFVLFYFGIRLRQKISQSKYGHQQDVRNQTEPFRLKSRKSFGTYEVVFRKNEEVE